jgi:hypothetical protein
MCGAVAVKAAPNPYERNMLLNEATIYDAFPRELQEGTAHAPPIVPKFYGYYVPSLKAFRSYADNNKLTKEDREKLEKIIRCITPILLVEPCGKEIRAWSLSSKDR